MTIRVVNSKMNPVQNPYTFRAHNRQHCNCTVAANIMETDNGYEIHMALPGVEKSEIEMTVTESILHVHSREKEQKPNEKRYIIKQFDNVYFSRKFRLDESIDTTQIGATLENGVLKIMLSKKTPEIKKAKSIEIR